MCLTLGTTGAGESDGTGVTVVRKGRNGQAIERRVSERMYPVIDGDGSSWLGFDGCTLNGDDESRAEQIVAVCSGENSRSVPERAEKRYDKMGCWLFALRLDSRPVACPLCGPIT